MIRKLDSWLTRAGLAGAELQTIRSRGLFYAAFGIMVVVAGALVLGILNNLTG